MSAQPVLLIHGGAWAMPDDAVAAHEDGIARHRAQEGERPNCDLDSLEPLEAADEQKKPVVAVADLAARISARISRSAMTKGSLPIHWCAATPTAR